MCVSVFFSCTWFNVVVLHNLDYSCGTWWFDEHSKGKWVCPFFSLNLMSCFDSRVDVLKGTHIHITTAWCICDIFFFNPNVNKAGLNSFLVGKWRRRQDLCTDRGMWRLVKGLKFTVPWNMLFCLALVCFITYSTSRGEKTREIIAFRGRHE